MPCRECGHGVALHEGHGCGAGSCGCRVNGYHALEEAVDAVRSSGRARVPLDASPPEIAGPE